MTRRGWALYDYKIQSLHIFQHGGLTEMGDVLPLMIWQHTPETEGQYSKGNAQVVTSVILTSTGLDYRSCLMTRGQIWPRLQCCNPSVYGRMHTSKGQWSTQRNDGDDAMYTPLAMDYITKVSVHLWCAEFVDCLYGCLA